MATSKTQTSTPKLSEVARHLVIPDGIVTTGYPSVQARCRELGFAHDPWQQGLGQIILGKRADGKYAATVGGVVISIPRQVGKTFLIGSIIFALCMKFPRTTVLWTAHRTRTSDETFAEMDGWTARPKIKPHALKARTVNGQQTIRFRNRSRILFGARETGFGRGFSKVDIEVFDEAQILGERALDDMIPATNQSRHPHGALLFYLGTPPKPVDPGEVFGGKRARALSGKSKDTVFVEFSADADADPDDPKQWAVANPSYPKRTDHEAMLRMRENLGSDESWLREALGIWDDDSLTEIPMGKWAACGDKAGQIVGQVILSLDMSFDRSRVCIGVAGQRADERRQVEVDVRSTGSFITSLVEASRQWNSPVMVATTGPAAAFIPEMQEAGIEVVSVGGAELAQACGHFYDSVVNGSLAHLDDQGLAAAVRGAQRRTGETYVFTRKGDVDISPLYAALLALWGWTTRHASGDILQNVW